VQEWCLAGVGGAKSGDYKRAGWWSGDDGLAKQAVLDMSLLHVPADVAGAVVQLRLARQCQY
jgi:hypothetical protein